MNLIRNNNHYYLIYKTITIKKINYILLRRVYKNMLFLVITITTIIILVFLMIFSKTIFEDVDLNFTSIKVLQDGNITNQQYENILNDITGNANNETDLSNYVAKKDLSKYILKQNVKEYPDLSKYILKSNLKHYYADWNLSNNILNNGINQGNNNQGNTHIENESEEYNVVKNNNTFSNIVNNMIENNTLLFYIVNWIVSQLYDSSNMQID